MAEHEHHHEETENLRPNQGSAGEGLDEAGKSLSEALRVSFIILKLIMLALVILFLASGFKTVEPGERALVLQFGRIRGIDQKRLLGPGPHWIWPYPVGTLVRIPVERKMTLAVGSFWYFQSPQELLERQSRIRPTDPLKPVIDGYCLTRSEHKSSTSDPSESDYNIVHTKWNLTYRIEDPELFFKNVYVEDPKPGQSYADVIEVSIAGILKSLVDDAVVAGLVNFTIDQVKEDVAAVIERVQGLLRQKLAAIGSGIEIVSLQLPESAWPRQVDDAFQAAFAARQASQQAVREASTYAETTLNEAAGPLAKEILSSLHDANVTEQQREWLWSQAAGAAREKIAEAAAYKTKVVETAKANADYLQQIIPEYNKNPKLVLHRLYLDAMQYVFENAQEKFIVQPSRDVGGTELRVMLNRDPTIKRVRQQETVEGPEKTRSGDSRGK